MDHGARSLCLGTSPEAARAGPASQRITPAAERTSRLLDPALPLAQSRSRNRRLRPRLVQPLVQPGRQGRERIPAGEPALPEDSRHRSAGGRRHLLGGLRLPSDCQPLPRAGDSRSQRGPSASAARALGAPRHARALPAGLQSIRPRRLPTFTFGADFLPARRAGRIHRARLSDGGAASCPGCDSLAGADQRPGSVRCAAWARAARLSRSQPHLPASRRGSGPPFRRLAGGPRRSRRRHTTAARRSSSCCWRPARSSAAPAAPHASERYSAVAKRAPRRSPSSWPSMRFIA